MNFFMNILNTRQNSVNRDVARYLQKEYPNESYDYILNMVEENRVHEMVK